MKDLAKPTRRNSNLDSAPTLKPSLPSHVSPAVKAGTQGGGQALDRRTSAEMSARFGHDFSQVRIHTDHRAGDAANTMGANAYALGSDIVFGEGNYVPGSPATERLLAHELTHVVQQSQFGMGDWGRTSRKGDASEREADGLASQVMRGQSVSVSAAPGAAVARDIDGDGISGALGDKLHDIFHMGPFTFNPIFPGAAPDAPDPHDDPRQKSQDDFNKDQAKQHGDDYPNPLDPKPSPSAPPGADFMPKPAPDPSPPYMPPLFQYNPTPFPGLGQSDPIAPQVPPLGTQPGLPGPLPPPSLFPPSPSPLPPMVPPLTLDPEA